MDGMCNLYDSIDVNPHMINQTVASERLYTLAYRFHTTKYVILPGMILSEKFLSRFSGSSPIGLSSSGFSGISF